MSGVTWSAADLRPDAAWWRSTTPTAWRALALALGGLGWMFDVCDNSMLALTLVIPETQGVTLQ